MRMEASRHQYDADVMPWPYTSNLGGEQARGRRSVALRSPWSWCLVFVVLMWLVPVSIEAGVFQPVDDAALEGRVESWIASEGGAWGRFFAVFFGTIALEDAAAIAVGLLVERGEIDPTLGMLGVFAGIFLGDLGLYLLGRVIGPSVLQWRRIRKVIPLQSVDRVRDWLDRRGWVAIVASRMVPGTRWPLYVVAGAVRCRSARFAWWTFLAAAIWVPIIVWGTALVGPLAVQPLEWVFGRSWFSLALEVSITHR